MNRPVVLACWMLCLLAIRLPASPAESKRPPWQTIVQFDNDLLTGTDRGYTNGTRVAFVREFGADRPDDNVLQKGLYPLSGATPDSPLHGWRLEGNQPQRFAWGFGLTQLMFTPDDPSALSAPAGERPYAGWLGLECSLHVKNSESVSSVTLSFGTTGDASHAEETQEWVHTNISNSPIYQGWDSQVPGEFTLNLHFDHKRRANFLDFSQDWPVEFDGYYEWGAALGNFRTDAYLGSLLRAGYNLPAAYSTPRVQLGSYGHALFSKQDPHAPRLSLYGFAGVRGSAVLHDITLDGPVFRNFDTGVNSEPFVGELLSGIGLRYAWAELSLSHTFRSNEFKGQDKNQEFGSVMLRLSTEF